MKTLLFIAALCLVFNLTQAQTHAAFGLKAGLNVANLTSENTANRESKISFHLGGLAHIHLSKEFAVQPELVYSGQGLKFTSPATGNKYNWSLNYINVPVMLQYMFNNGFRLETGPQLGFLINVDEEKNGVETGDLVKDDFKSTDFSWGFGASYLTHTGFGIGGRYNAGLSNINDYSTAVTKNQVFQVGVFYMFDTNHK